MSEASEYRQMMTTRFQRMEADLASDEEIICTFFQFNPARSRCGSAG
jgi:hypothetical protein